MLADPAVVTINAVARNLVRINQDGYSSEYQLILADQKFTFAVRNSSRFDSKRAKTIYRHNVEMIWTVFPVTPSTISMVRKAYVVLENEEGDTLVDPRNMLLGLCAYLSSANIDKILNQES
jgi:hypothetical protein